MAGVDAGVHIPCNAAILYRKPILHVLADEDSGGRKKISFNILQLHERI